MSEEYESQNVNSEGYHFSNQGYQDATALHYRLDTRPILEDLEAFLKGFYLKPVVNQVTGEYELRPVSSGSDGVITPKANSKGINSIMAFVSLKINSQCVQANFTSEQYNDYIDEVHEDLADMLMMNAPDWGIDESDYQIIVSSIMHIIIPFFTRPIDNKERDSYGASMQTRETITPAQRQKTWGLFNK